MFECLSGHFIRKFDGMEGQSIRGVFCEGSSILVWRIRLRMVKSLFLFDEFVESIS